MAVPICRDPRVLEPTLVVFSPWDPASHVCPVDGRNSSSLKQLMM